MAEDNATINMREIHHSARALIIAAAEKSGLLEEVAELLWFAEKHSPPMDCVVCELLRQLTEAFDNHVCLAGRVAEEMYICEGLSISPHPDEARAVDVFK